MIKLFDICKISKLCIIVAFALVLDISFTNYSYAQNDPFANATMDAFNLGAASRRGDKETAQKILENNNVDRETAKKIVDRDITLCKGIKRFGFFRAKSSQMALAPALETTTSAIANTSFKSDFKYSNCLYPGIVSIKLSTLSFPQI